MDNQAVIQVDTVTKYYGTNNAVEKVSFQVGRGELFGIIGKSGAGKTTLLELLMGLRIPDAGGIKVLGLDVLHESERLKEYINFYMQSTSLVDKMNVREALELFQSLYNCGDNVDCLIEQFGLEAYVDKMVKRLSGGLRQLTTLAITIVHNPQIIFLDEPTTGLDLKAKSDYWSILASLKKQGKTIVIISHDMAEIQRHCDRVSVMRDGELVICNSPSNLISQLPGGGLTMEAVYMHYAVNAQGGVQV